MTATASKSKSGVKIKPLNDKVVIEKAEAEEKTEGGIYLPGSSQEKPSEGHVVAVGPGPLNEKNERQPLQVKEGDIVLYSKFAGTEIKHEGRDFLIVSEKDILAIVEK